MGEERRAREGFEGAAGPLSHPGSFPPPSGEMLLQDRDHRERMEEAELPPVPGGGAGPGGGRYRVNPIPF